MTESKIDATDRLRREGRWSEASLFRDEKRRKLHGEGMNRSDAGDAAWEAMVEKYPPLTVPEVESPALPSVDRDIETIEAVLALTESRTPNIVADVEWVYATVGDEAVEPNGVPNLGAWGMWRWARSNRNEFFEGLWPKAAAVKSKRNSRRDAESHDDLFAMDMEYEREELERREKWSKSLSRDMPTTICGSVAAELTCMVMRFELEVSRDAGADLGTRMVELSRQFIAAALENPTAFQHEK
jgi:hypothetical protein